MTSPLQVLYFIAITLAPSGTNHITVSAGSEVYDWDRSASQGDVATWVYDASIDPREVLVKNDVAPYDLSAAKKSIAHAAHQDGNTPYVLEFDNAHQLQKSSGGYVYVVRPGSPNQKTYSFTFSR